MELDHIGCLTCNCTTFIIILAYILSAPFQPVIPVSTQYFQKKFYIACFSILFQYFLKVCYSITRTWIYTWVCGVSQLDQIYLESRTILSALWSIRRSTCTHLIYPAVLWSVWAQLISLCLVNDVQQMFYLQTFLYLKNVCICVYQHTAGVFLVVSFCLPLCWMR